MTTVKRVLYATDLSPISEPAWNVARQFGRLFDAEILLVHVVSPAPAGAHGTMNNPPSRTMVCYTEGPENPKSAACRKAVELGGTQPLYDWNEVNIADAAGRHREIIPDGRLCSAGRDKYRGFDQARADWPSTSLTSGAAHTFTYRATAPHKGGFQLYITKDGYDPTRPLKLNDHALGAGSSSGRAFFSIAPAVRVPSVRLSRMRCCVG